MHLIQPYIGVASYGHWDTRPPRLSPV